MPADLSEQLRDAAASPTRDAPLPLIEARLRRRHRTRRGAATLGVFALLAGISGVVVAAVGGSGPKIESLRFGAQVSAFGLTVDIPDGWVQGEAFDHLVVGSDLGETCPGNGSEALSSAFVEVGDLDTRSLQLQRADPSFSVIDRPEDFRTATPSQDARCVTAGGQVLASITEYAFRDAGRTLYARVTIGAAAPPELTDQAYAVLNSLQVGAVPPPTLPTTTIPPSTVPESTDTTGIRKAFEGWVSSKPPAFAGNEAFVDDWASIEPTAKAAGQAAGNPQCYTGRVDAITRIGAKDADVIFTFLCNGQPASIINQAGQAVKVNGVWMVSRETACAAYAVGGFSCPPRKS